MTSKPIVKPVKVGLAKDNFLVRSASPCSVKVPVYSATAADLTLKATLFASPCSVKVPGCSATAEGLKPESAPADDAALAAFVAFAATQRFDAAEVAVICTPGRQVTRCATAGQITARGCAWRLCGANAAQGDSERRAKIMKCFNIFNGGA